MERPDQSGPQSNSELTRAIDRLWVRFLPEIQERLAVLTDAAAAVGSQKLTTQQCEDAHAAAHKMAGVLGTFGLARGTELARELEVHFSCSDALDPASSNRLAAATTELRTMIENRRTAG